MEGDVSKKKKARVRVGARGRELPVKKMNAKTGGGQPEALKRKSKKSRESRFYPPTHRGNGVDTPNFLHY